MSSGDSTSSGRFQIDHNGNEQLRAFGYLAIDMEAEWIHFTYTKNTDNTDNHQSTINASSKKKKRKVTRRRNTKKRKTTVVVQPTSNNKKDDDDDNDDNVVVCIRKVKGKRKKSGNESFDVYDDSDTDLAKLDTLINENDIFIETNLIDDENYMAEEIYIDEQNISDVEIPKIYEYIKTTEIKQEYKVTNNNKQYLNKEQLFLKADERINLLK
jgi:hypothetical protein